MPLWLEVLKILPGWVAVSLVVYDQTAGYPNRGATWKIPMRKFEELTGLSRPAIIHAVRTAEARKVIRVHRDVPAVGLSWSRKVPLYSMNPPEEWLPRTAQLDKSVLTSQVGNTGLTSSLDKTGLSSCTGEKDPEKERQGLLEVGNTGFAKSRKPSTIERDDIIDTIDTPIYSPIPIPPPRDPSTNTSAPKGTTTHENSSEEFSSPPNRPVTEEKSPVLKFLRSHGEATRREIYLGTLPMTYADVGNHLKRLQQSRQVENPRWGIWRATK